MILSDLDRDERGKKKEKRGACGRQLGKVNPEGRKGGGGEKGKSSRAIARNTSSSILTSIFKLLGLEEKKEKKKRNVLRN